MSPQPELPFVEVTELVGRRDEIADLRLLLGDYHLVTVTGPGGVGKTRTAQRAARESADGFPDGVSFADLSGLSDPELLPATVAAALGMMRGEARPQIEAVLDYLRTRRLLLVLDTCEHLIDACALFAEQVLEQAPNVTVLATSRQPLTVAGEHVFSLAPLPVPGPADKYRGSVTGTGDAAELFAQCATAADQRFAVTAANWPDVVRICRRLNGMPLAVELAAARVRELSLRELADQLAAHFGTLAARRGGPERHQTLESAIEWSYGLCTENERVLWARLSVFAGSFTLAAAREVCSGQGLAREAVLPALVGLAEKSLVSRDGDRYRMLDTIRESGAARLAGSGREAACQGRHVGWYLDLAHSYEKHFLDHDQPARIRTLRDEHENLQAALRYGLDSGHERLVREAADLAASLMGYWMPSGQMHEGRHWVSLALDRLPAGPSPERAKALTVQGYLGVYTGEPEQAVEEATAGVEMARDLGDEPLLARGYVYQEIALVYADRLDEAFIAGAEARLGLEKTGDHVGLTLLEAQEGHLHELAGDLEAAVKATERCLRRLREGSADGEIGEEWLQSLCYTIAGVALLFLGREADSQRCFGRALSLQMRLRDTVGCACALEGLGWLASGSSRWDRAAWLLGAADTLWKQAGARLMGNPILEQFHEQMAGAAQEGLGGSRFGELFAAGAGYPLHQLANHAIRDADALPAPGSRTGISR